MHLQKNMLLRILLPVHRYNPLEEVAEVLGEDQAGVSKDAL
jgi:hypothetical protein